MISPSTRFLPSGPLARMFLYSHQFAWLVPGGKNRDKPLNDIVEIETNTSEISPNRNSEFFDYIYLGPIGIQNLERFRVKEMRREREGEGKRRDTEEELKRKSLLS